MDSAEAFIQNPYPTYEDLVQEFKNKLIGLVPDDFSWDAHIGRSVMQPMADVKERDVFRMSLFLVTKYANFHAQKSDKLPYLL